MNSNSHTRFSLSSHSTKQQLPLQPLSKLNQEPSFSQRSFREKPSQKLLKPTDSFSSKTKMSKQYKAKENVFDSKSTTISIVSKIPDEKEETLFVPSKAIRNQKTDHKTEKSFQDLNRSLANLALRRCVGRSSSDNDAICHISQTEADCHQRSYGGGFSTQYMDTQPNFTLTSKTPYVNKKSSRGFQTSVQKGMEVTPFSFVNQNTENENLEYQQERRDISSKDLTLSDIDSGKLPGSDYRKDVRPTHNNHYLPFDTKVRAQGKNFITEGSYRMEFSQIDHLDNTDTQMCSQYISNDIQLSYLNGDYCQEMGTETLKDNELENQLEVVHHLNLRQDKSSKNKPATIQKKNPKLAQFSAQQNFRSTPAFKGVLRGKDLRNNLPHRNPDSNPRRYSDLASIPRVTTGNMDRSLRATRENSEKIDLNNISDDVEYIMGGVGTTTRSKKQKPNVRNKSSFLASEANDTFPKQDGFESVRRETLDVWKQDIIKIKKEMESRKKSYAEVNKFVKFYEKETVAPKVRESRDSSFDMHATRKTSNISSVNASRFEKMDTIKPYSSGLKSLVTQESAKPVKQNRNKASFDLKTAEDFDDQKSVMGLTEEQSSAISRFRVQTTNPYYEYSNDPFEANNAFLYDKNVVLEKTQKQACCGSEKMCNMF